MTRLSHHELNKHFVEALGDCVVRVDDINAETLTLEVTGPRRQLLRAYLFNATNPPGGRPNPEHKINLIVPGQARGERGNFDFSGGRAVLLVGKVEDQDVFVLWDASLYKDFGYSRNVQVRTATIEEVEAVQDIRTQPRRTRLGDEKVVVTPSALLAEAVKMRFSAGASGHPPVVPSGAAVPDAGGTPYVSPPRTTTQPKTRVFEFDPDAIDRGTAAHMNLQDALAQTLRENGLVPLSPRPADPQFDIAWVQDGVAYVGEVKSLTSANQDRQLRLGLGQVLSYVHLLDWPNVHAVRAVLAVEHRPDAEYWTALCADHDVILTWPEVFDEIFVDRS